MSEEKQEVREKLALHLSSSAMQAGKNFDSFKKLMEWAYKNAPSEVRFTCPDTEKITAERDEALDLIEEMAGALEHCRDFDTSAKFGYDYGQEVRGRVPKPGSRWKTPKESAMDALNKYKQWKVKNGK